jgi:hypothetical protein
MEESIFLMCLNVTYFIDGVGHKYELNRSVLNMYDELYRLDMSKATCYYLVDKVGEEIFYMITFSTILHRYIKISFRRTSNMDCFMFFETIIVNHRE